MRGENMWDKQQDTKFSGEGGEEFAQGAQDGIPLQIMVKTMVRQLCLCSPWRSIGMQRAICSPWRSLTLEQGDA